MRVLEGGKEIVICIWVNIGIGVICLEVTEKLF